MTNDWLYLRGSSDGKIYSYRASTQEWEELSVPAEESFDPNDPPSTLTVDLNSSVSLDMIWCPPGTFMMGSPETEDGRNFDETEHEVTLTQGYYLGKYEVTQSQYEAVMTGNANSLSADPSQYKGGSRPVETVSWDDAQVFLTRLNAQQSANIPSGWAYVLPTESQWEYACRAGTATAYSWGNDTNLFRANYIDQTKGGLMKTSDVGNYDANPWGFFDMHGNVWEWTADWFAEYSSEAQTDPAGPASGSYRVIRGGSWHDNGDQMRSAERDYFPPDFKPSGNRGFRVGLQKSL
jgi:formylglycine-generating enzyme required for sulfatase activity